MLNAPPIPPYLLIHTVQYTPWLQDSGLYSKPSYGDSIEIRNVRVDILSDLKRSSVSKELDGVGAIVFVDAMGSSYKGSFEADSIIQFEGKDYKIIKVIPCYQPGTNTIHHYELELI